MLRMASLTAADWHARAEEARVLATQLTDIGARQTMLAIADGYERLARHAVEWADVMPFHTEDD